MNMKHVITWFDLPTTDFNRAVQFYSTILDSPVRVDDSMGTKLGFFPMEGREGVGGDIVPPSDDFKPSLGGTRVYLNCDRKLDEVLGRVKTAGGEIVQSKTHIGDPGFIAMIRDTEGNTIGLHSMK
jgi:predicted enzyme related to lactoylglutathione lyase